MSFGALEGAYVADYLPYLQTLQDMRRSGQTTVTEHNRENSEQVFARANGLVKELVLQLEALHRRNLVKTILVLLWQLIRILLSIWLGHGLKKMDKIEYSDRALFNWVGWIRIHSISIAYKPAFTLTHFSGLMLSFCVYYQSIYHQIYLLGSLGKAYE